MQWRSVTAEEMRRLDQKASEDFGIPSLLLMENAGRGIAELIFNLRTARRILILCGKGNNGGDGFVIARHLSNRGLSVKIVLCADPAKLSGDTKINFDIVSKMKIPCTVISDHFEENRLAVDFQNADLIVDALFGVGLNAPLVGLCAKVVTLLNHSGREVLSVDIPSGLHADTGQALGVAVVARMTATLGLPKKGLFAKEGPKHAGKILVIDIGLPKEILQ